MEKEIQVYHYEGEGLQVSYDNTKWIVGVKNYKPASDVQFMDCLERHLLTDELFVPITAGSKIVSLALEEGAELRVQKMEVGRIYSVPQGLWHNAVMEPGGKIILIERPGTGVDNSEFRKLSSAERETLSELVKKL